MKHLKTYEKLGKVLYWKVYTEKSSLILEAGLYKISVKCLEYFKYEVDYLKNEHNTEKAIWIYKESKDSWQYDGARSVKDPETVYPDDNLKYMGEIKVTEKDIEEYKFYLDAKNYNL